MPTSRLVIVAVAVGLGATLGCGPAARGPSAPPPPEAHAHAHDHADHASAPAVDHDHDHDVPTSFADGIAKLRSLGDDLADKLTANAGEAADDAVHDIGHLLEEVRGLAKRESLEAGVAAGLDELEECFGKVDEAFHSGDADADPRQVLASVKDRLEAAFRKLSEAR